MTEHLHVQLLEPDRRTASQMAILHQRTITDGFLTSLGSGLLTEMYLGLLRSHSSFSLGARTGSELMGFISCTTATSSTVIEAVRRNPLGFVRSAPRLVRLSRLRRAFESLTYAASVPEGLPMPEILNFSVDPNRQGTGVGRELFAAAVDEFARRGVESIRIVTGVTQLSAQRFYEAAGAEKVADLTVHRGTGSIAYVFAIGG